MSTHLQRLPRLTPTSEYDGVVYVLRSRLNNQYYKIGFSRGHANRRASDNEGELLFTINAGQQPCVLENIIHRRFTGKRVSDTEMWGREWFQLEPGDLEWLRGLARTSDD